MSIVFNKSIFFFGYEVKFRLRNIFFGYEVYLPYRYISLIGRNVKICTKSVHGFICFLKTMYKICTWYAYFARLEVIIIGVLNKKDYLEERCEYPSPTRLDSDSENYFVIPSSILLENIINEKRATVFSFFSVYRGLSNRLFFSINNIVKWMGKQPNRNANGINNKIIQVINNLNDGGYLTLFDELTHSSCIEANFDITKISQECDYSRFAVIYIDELQKILNYQCTKDTFLNNDIILLVFAYLRMKIFRRRNKLLPEEINVDNKNNHQYDIETRRLSSPDAYDCYYSEIAEELGLSARTVSKAVTELNNLGLIYSESLPRIKVENKWRTDHTIFCNAYKREGNYLLANGSVYYLSEIENKKKKIKL